MTKANERKKQPALVRRSLLDNGARLCVEQGVAGLTLQAVANAAGVTKGGLLHHFSSKQVLIEEIFNERLQAFDTSISLAMKLDFELSGCFTRAYITATLEQIEKDDFIHWAALMMLLLTEPGLKKRWAEWLERLLERHRGTDSGPELQLARYAVDGLWLAGLLDEKERTATKREVLHLHSRLIEMTRKS
jgi:AcrR family transcriptional regulator